MRARQFARTTPFAAALLLAGAVWAAPRWTPEYEKKVGAEAAVEVEKKWKVVADEAQLKRLAGIVNAVSAVSSRPQVAYTVKIVDLAEVNAFSLPGGFVYVTQGLLKDVQSEDELAGILAHEVTHNAFYDALERAEKSKKLFMGSLAAALGALIVGAKSQQVSAALAAGEYIRLGVLSKYSLDVEQRADSYALKYLIATGKYNPVGMLTFMERLAAEERHKPKQELGVYADHPDTDVRCRLLVDQLEDAGVDINRRAVTKWDHPKAEEKDVAGKKTAVLSLWGVEVFNTTFAAEAKSPLERTQAMADALTRALGDGLESYQVVAEVKAPQPRVMVGREVLLTVCPEDATAAGLSAEDLARQVASSLNSALHKEALGRWW